jgi:hypothetical protein
LDLTAPLPLDPHERQDQWHRAVLMVALVVTGMTDATRAIAGPPPAASRRARPPAGSSSRRGIRPPRSC